MKVPHFIVKKNLQKSRVTEKYFSDIITETILLDICQKVTGCTSFTYDFVENNYCDEYLEATYNKGRVAVLLYNDTVTYISFSEKGIDGRNSSVQSIPTAFNMFYKCNHRKKSICYYFLDCEGNAETDYLIFMYRLMKTVGFRFLNLDTIIENKIYPFISIEDIIITRKITRGRNRSNNSTYIDKNKDREYEIYGKTYGANKYETAMISYAISLLSDHSDRVILYEVMDGDLKELPSSCLDVLKDMGKIKIIPTSMTLEKNIFNANNLRSPKFIFNLFEKLGYKKCAFCNCSIQEMIQGAHIWPVSDIKEDKSISEDEKLFHATSGDNGLWLCNNHHKLFDEHLIGLNLEGELNLNSDLDKDMFDFIHSITETYQLPIEILTDNLKSYIKKRYS